MRCRRPITVNRGNALSRAFSRPQVPCLLSSLLQMHRRWPTDPVRTRNCQKKLLAYTTLPLPSDSSPPLRPHRHTLLGLPLWRKNTLERKFEPTCLHRLAQSTAAVQHSPSSAPLPSPAWKVNRCVANTLAPSPVPLPSPAPLAFLATQSLHRPPAFMAPAAPQHGLDMPWFRSFFRTVWCPVNRADAREKGRTLHRWRKAAVRITFL